VFFTHNDNVSEKCQPYVRDPAVLSTDKLGDDIPRISTKTTTLEEFIERFEKPRQPCIITDAMDG
jgi:ethanolamine ammonia-lyase large subunit